MHTISNTTARHLGFVFAGLMVLALSLVLVPKAHAADLYGGDTGWYADSYTDSYPAYDTYGGDWTDTGYYDNGSGWTDTGYYDNTPSYDYGCSSCSTGGYSYSTPGYGCGSCGYTPSYVPPVYQPPVISMPGFGYTPPSNTNVNTNTNTITTTNVNDNTCTGNSCNTTISTPINAPTTVTITNPNNNSTPSYQPVYQPVPVYQPIQQPYYAPTVYNNPRPIAYNTPTPRVSLSQVPYTGLDLGPVGTALYWGFLVLWCLVAAYLIAVKRVQNKVVAAIFRKKATAHVAHSAHAAPAHAPAPKKEAPVVATSKFGNIDPFIASQLSKIA